MTFPIKAVLFLLTLGIACSLIMVGTLKGQVPKSAGSAVFIKSSIGTGSGVHIGGGYILTAAHVTVNDKTATVILDSGEEVQGEVFWHNGTDLGSYDVALIYVGPQPSLAESDLSCAPSWVGQDIRIVGNPLGMQFQTTWGKVAGFLPSPYGQWREAVSLDITAAPGVSGGPVFDAISGKIVGLLVGGRQGFAYTIMVPGSALCRLLARDA